MGSNFQWFLDYSERIKRLVAEEEVRILGQIKVSDDEYGRLIQYVRTMMLSPIQSKEIRADLLISLALVQYAIREYKDGTFWPGFFEESQIKYDSSSTTFLGKTFNWTIKFYKLWNVSTDSQKEQYVENIKAHAFVTNNYMDGFFEFADAYYENTLFRCLPDDPEELIDELEDLSSFMRSSLSGNANQIQTGTGKAEKTYKLLLATRRAFAQCDPYTLNSFFYPILKMIDQHFYDDYLPVAGANRFIDRYVEWQQKKDREEISIDCNNGPRKRTRSIYNRKPFIEISSSDERNILHIPEQRFRQSECDGTVFVNVSINGYTERKEAYVRDSFGTYISMPVTFVIPSAFDEIVIGFDGIDDKQYVIKSRDYRILNSEWSSKDKLTEGINEIIVKKSTPIIFDEACEVISEDLDFYYWKHFTVRVSSNSTIQIGKRTISTVGEYSKYPIFENEILRFSAYRRGGEPIVCTTTHPIISFETEKNKVNGTAIIVNEEKYLCRDMHKTILPLSRESDIVAVSIDLNECLPMADDVYSITIDIPGIGEKPVCEYLVLREIKLRMSKNLYCFDKYAEVVINNRVHGFTLSNEWEAYIEDGRQSYRTLITPDLKEARVQLNLYGLGEMEFELRMPVNLISYGFSPNEIIVERTVDSYHWYADLTDNLYIRHPRAKNICVYYEDEYYNQIEAVKVSDGIFRADISSIRDRIVADSGQRYHHIRFISDNSRRHTSIADIYRSPVIDNVSMLAKYDDGIGLPIQSFVGDAKMLLTVRETETQALLIENYELSVGNNILCGLNTNTSYDFTYSMEETDEFGLGVYITELFYRKNIKLVDIDNLTGFSILLEKVFIDGAAMKLSQRYIFEPFRVLEDGSYMCRCLAMDVYEDGRTNWKSKKPLKLVNMRMLEFGDVCKAYIMCKLYDSRAVSSSSEWSPFYYDVKKKRLLHAEDNILTVSKEYARFIELDADISYYTFDLKKIRRS